MRVVLDLDGERQATVQSGVGYFDHMLELFAYHGKLDLGVSADGNLEVDDHHTIEEVGVCIGQAIRQAIGDGEGIDGYGTAHALADDDVRIACREQCGRLDVAADMNRCARFLLQTIQIRHVIDVSVSQ